jgi:hypothetical protein
VFYISQLPGKRGEGPKGWAIQSKLNIMIWLGLHKHKKDYLKDAPKGYDMVTQYFLFNSLSHATVTNMFRDLFLLQL